MLGPGAVLRLWKKEWGIRQAESCSVKRSASSQENQFTDLQHFRYHGPVQEGILGGSTEEVNGNDWVQSKGWFGADSPQLGWGLSLPVQGSGALPHPPVYRLRLWFAGSGPAP